MSLLYVRLYVNVHKKDDRDAEAIADGTCRPRRQHTPSLSRRRRTEPGNGTHLTGYAATIIGVGGDRSCPVSGDCAASERHGATQVRFSRLSEFRLWFSEIEVELTAEALHPSGGP